MPSNRPRPPAPARPRALVPGAQAASAARRLNRPLLSPGAGEARGTRRSRPRSPALPRALARPRPSRILIRGGTGAGQRGRRGLELARAGTHRGGRCDCEVALTHVPGFLSGQGGGGSGCARAGLGRWRSLPRGVAGPKSVPLAQSRCPSLTDSPSFHQGRTAPDPAAS